MRPDGINVRIGSRQINLARSMMPVRMRSRTILSLLPVIGLLPTRSAERQVTKPLSPIDKLPTC
jgi:hypothetical protein